MNIARRAVFAGAAVLDNLFVVDFSKVKPAAWRSAWNRDIKRG
jgi:hypothetical protein